MFGWFKKKDPSMIAEVSTLQDQKDISLRTMILTADIKIQTRRAQNLAPDYAVLIRSLCVQESSLRAAYVLDMRRPDKEGQWLLIELLLDDPTHMPQIAERFASSLNTLPDWERTYIRLAEATTIQHMKNAEFYLRK